MIRFKVYGMQATFDGSTESFTVEGNEDLQYMLGMMLEKLHRLYPLRYYPNYERNVVDFIQTDSQLDITEIEEDLKEESKKSTDEEIVY